MEGEAKSKTEETSWLTVLCCRRPNKVNFINHSNTPGISMHTFPKGGKTKTKMDDLRQDSQTGLPTEYFVLCSEHFEALCFSRSVLIGTPVDFKRFEKHSVPSIDAKGTDLLDTDYPRNEGRLANRFFPRNILKTFFETLPRNVSIQNPPPPAKKTSTSFQIG